ncbi:MAG: type I-U CRISPR-associated protein Csx17 [Phycisphaeraceae bacterium]|nr:MAG: type I-U CRISPR-associated protein Csx17 [Phycisphaeraceae bacterium]
MDERAGTETPGVSGTRSVVHKVVLGGCTPEPLMSYLKALGILRLVCEDHGHGDPGARGFWRDDVFELWSRLDGTGLEDFFLYHYRPTPIVAPWAGGSGFFKKDNRQAINAMLGSSEGRVARYRETIRGVQAIIDEEHIGDKPQGDDKARLIQRYRRELPDAVVAWMDAAMVLKQAGQSFAPILGTGGNDGRLDFTQNFMQRVVLLGLHQSQPADRSVGWIRQALFGTATRMNSASVGQFAPGRAGGPNSTQGMEGDSADNPWEFVMMLEGSLVLAGAAVRRLGAAGDGRTSFPFTVQAAGIGYASTGRDEVEEARGELWMPLWARAASISEVTALFGEGRAEVHGRPARDAVNFARAAATLGVDRGIASFSRVSLLKRSGKSFLATPAGRFVVTERPDAELLREVDPWLDSFRRACAGDNVPARFTVALRAIDAAVFDFCRYGGPAHFAEILMTLGRAEREMARTPGKIGSSKTKVSPLAGLSFRWVRAAAGGVSLGSDASFDTRRLDTGFQIALALAGVRAAEGSVGKIGPLRANLEPVEAWYGRGIGRTRAKWAENDRAVVWNAADLSSNLAAVLARRVMDGERGGCDTLPIAPSRDALTASPEAIVSFLRGDVDERRIEDLLWGLMLVDPPSRDQPFACRGGSSGSGDRAAGLPSVYDLLKLLFLPRDLVKPRRPSETRWSLARPGERGTHRIRPEPAILALLRAGRVGEAAGIAMRRLRASGLTPVPHRRSGGPSRDGVWSEVRVTPRDGQRLAAALLIPIDPDAIDAIVRRATRIEENEKHNAAPDGSGMPTGSPAAYAAAHAEKET